jgi:hypothetical protein
VADVAGFLQVHLLVVSRAISRNAQGSDALVAISKLKPGSSVADQVFDAIQRGS